MDFKTFKLHFTLYDFSGLFRWNKYVVLLHFAAIVLQLVLQITTFCATSSLLYPNDNESHSSEIDAVAIFFLIW